MINPEPVKRARILKKKFDVIIIGAGVVGAMIARELSRFSLDVVVLERAADVCAGTSKANSAIIHAGYAAPSGTIKGELCCKGNRAYDRICRQLSVPFRRVGSFVAAMNSDEEALLGELKKNGDQREIPGLKIISGEDAKSLEPNISTEVKAALYAPTAGIINPFILTFALCENAKLNGVTFHTEKEVTAVLVENGRVAGVEAGGREYYADFVINAAGLYSDIISDMAGESALELNIVKGEYLVSDTAMGRITSRILFPAPSRLSKGILIAPTTDGNTIFGPTARPVKSREDTATTSEGASEIRERAVKLIPGIDFKGMITAYAGLRAKDKSDDFVIGASSVTAGFINAAGIQSPGLTAAPAIAETVVNVLKEEGLPLQRQKGFYGTLKQGVKISEMSIEAIERSIALDPAYGHIICRCETVSEGEVVDAIRGGATTTDAVKFRKRAGSGRCQSGFCGPKVVEILAHELNIPMDEVTKRGKGSNVLAGRIDKNWS